MALADVAFRPPRIETERVVLRGYEPSDAASIFSYASDLETTRYMAWDRAQRVEDVERFLDFVVAPSYARQELEYAVTLRGAEQDCIGGIGLVWRPREHQLMELGYILHRQHWGQGLIPEAGRALMAHAFATTSVERVFAPILAPNAKSRRTAEKLGMHLDGILRAQLVLRGQRWDEAVYSLLRAEVKV